MMPMMVAVFGAPSGERMFDDPHYSEESITFPSSTTKIFLCFASVLLAQLYTKGVLSLGSLIAGLCAASGLGILVLVKENKHLKDTVTIIGLLLGISIGAGVLVQAAGIMR